MTTGAMTRWRIYTEYVHSRHIAKIVDKYFTDYSMFSGIGHYDDKQERYLVIEIITDVYNAMIDIISICREINSDNHQECCFVTSETVNTMLIAEKK